MTEPKSLMSSLDTSGFDLSGKDEYDDEEDYTSSYFDIEKEPFSGGASRDNEFVGGSAKFETNMFDLGPLSEEYDGSDDPYGDASSSSLSAFSSVSSSLPSQTSNLSSMPRRPANSKIPIRNVLDIFQELKLSFGRKSRRWMNIKNM